MNHITTFVGLDVHKSSISIAFASAIVGQEPQFVKKITSDVRKLLKELRKLGAPGSIRVCYEAGPTGYGILRRLRQEGFAAEVIAPAMTPKSASDKVKTDRRDALKLAECLRNGQLTSIYVPTEQEEALRDLIRAREDLKRVDMNTKRQMSSMLLRYGRAWEGKSNWTKAHLVWISQQRFEHQATTEAHSHYLGELHSLKEKVAHLDQLIHEEALKLPNAPLYKAFMTVKGIKALTAATLVVEIGDFRRFKTAGRFMSFLGLTPSLYASGDRAVRGRITKAGNRRLRRLLVESAWSYRCAPHVSRDLQKQSQGIAAGPRAIAWQAQKRLHRKTKAMQARGMNHKKMLIAVARELAGFVWAIAQEDKLVESAA